MPVFAVFAAFAALGALALHFSKGDSHEGGSTIPESVRHAVSIAKAPGTDPGELEAASLVATHAGEFEIAKFLHDRAELLRVAHGPALAPAQQHVGNVPAPQFLKSPIPEATDPQWTEFVRSQSTDPGAKEPRAWNTVNERNELGRFLLSYHALKDLGYATNVHKVESEAGGTVWTGDLTRFALPQFLNDKNAQYRIFVELMLRFREEILKRHVAAIGQIIEGKPITFSALLTLANHAGKGGAALWLSNPSKRFPLTTREVLRATGIF